MTIIVIFAPPPVFDKIAFYRVGETIRLDLTHEHIVGLPLRNSTPPPLPVRSRLLDRLAPENSTVSVRHENPTISDGSRRTIELVRGVTRRVPDKTFVVHTSTHVYCYVHDEHTHTDVTVLRFPVSFESADFRKRATYAKRQNPRIRPTRTFPLTRLHVHCAMRVRGEDGRKNVFVSCLCRRNHFGFSGTYPQRRSYKLPDG